MKRDKWGRLIHFEQYSTDGKTHVWDGLDKCKNIIVIKWNESDYSLTGVSHLSPAYTDINGARNMKDYFMEIYKRDARPMVRHVLATKDQNKSPTQIKAEFKDRKTMLSEAKKKQMTDLMETDAWDVKTNDIGKQSIDFSPIGKFFTQQRQTALRYPDMTTGLGTNKATMEVIQSHFSQFKIGVIQQKHIDVWIEPLYAKVLKELNVVAPTPTHKFIPLPALDKVVEATFDTYMVAMLGPSWEKVVAEKNGIKDYDPEWRAKQSESMAKAQSQAIPKELRKDGLHSTPNKGGSKRGEEN
jgi:hypothetical protein